MNIEQLGLQKAELQNLSVELEQAEQALAEAEGVSHFHIEDLGLKKDELQNLIVERTVRELLDTQGLDEDGDAYLGDSPFATEMKRLIQDEIKRHVAETAEKHCLPLVGQHIEEVVLQETKQR